MSKFNGSTLLISARSPFARRVRLAFFEHDVKFTEKIYNVFEQNADLTKLNPLSRVPTLLLPTGETLIDSNLILQFFYENTRASSLIPFNENERILNYKWSGIAAGIC